MTTTAHLPSRCERIALRGLTCNVRHWGPEGAPRLFMLHGRQDASPTFQFVVDALKRGWHVIAPDWRGHGASGWQHAPYAIADLCQTANIARAVHISSPDGTSFATSYTVVLSGAGSIADRYSDANGSVVSATVTNIVAGSRILMKRTDTNAVLSNSVVAGTTFSLNVQTASAIPISVRVRKASSAPYYQEWSTTGLIDPVVGFAATANQQPDQ